MCWLVAHFSFLQLQLAGSCRLAECACINTPPECACAHGQEAMPEMPSAARQRYLSAGIGAKETLAMTDDMATAGYYDAAVAAGTPAKTAANWVLGDLTAHCKVLQRCGEGM